MRSHFFICMMFVFFITNVGEGQQISGDSGYINVKDGKLYYEMKGEGDETIIFLHDGLVHGEIWNNQFLTFAENFRVIRYDRRGYGRSPMPELPYSSIEDLHTIFNYLKVNKAILIGMSAGGRLALDFALKHPEKVSSLILVSAVVSGFSFSDHFWTRGGRLVAADFNNPEKLLRYYIKEDPYEIAPKNEEAKEKLWKLIKPYPPNIDFIINNRLEEQPEHPAIEELHKIQLPTLIVVGEYDIPDIFIHTGAIEAGIKNSQKVIIRDAGHRVPFEKPNVFNEQVTEFLNGSEFFWVLNSKGVAEVIEMFNNKRKKDNEWIPFTETRMNSLGYQYLQSGKTNEAIEIFKLNVLAYPESANVYDSLGEAYMINGNKKLAIKNYKKSVELNPDNNNGIRMLEKLQKKANE